MIRVAHHVRIVRSTLCVAIAVVFFVMMGVGALNAGQHAAPSDHDHVHGWLALTLGDSDHDDHLDDPSHGEGDHADIAEDEDPSDGAVKAHSGASHHHHLDAPTGVIDRVALDGGDLRAAGVRLLGGDDRLSQGISPSGLKRPPRPIRIAV